VRTREFSYAESSSSARPTTVKTVSWRKLLRKLFFVAVCANCVVSVVPADDSGSPTYGRRGLDTAGIDRSTKPGDDFYQYAGGAWLAHASIPADKPEVSLWRELIARTEMRLHDLLETSARTAAHRPQDLNGKIGAFYRSFMDEQRVEQLGGRPIEPELTAIRQARTRETIAALMGRTNSDYEDSLFSIAIDVDLRDSKRYVVYLSQGVGYLSPIQSGLGLPDRDYYLASRFKQKKAVYQTYVEQLLRMLDWPAPALRSREIVEFETHLAQAMWTRAQDRDPVATYNAMTVAQLRALAADFPWSTFLASAGLPTVDHIVVGEPSAFQRITAIYVRTPVQVLQAWQAFHVADHAAPYLSTLFSDAWFAFHERDLSGQKQQRARWQRAVTAVAGGNFLEGERFGTFGTMGWGVGELYTAKYFPPAVKDKTESVARTVVSAFRSRLQRLDWMGSDTKREAIRKLDTYVIKIGYPEHSRDYASLVIADDDLAGNVRRAGAFDWSFRVRRLPSAVDRTEWLETPQSDEMYNGNFNDIVFPAASLQAPLYDPNADEAVNYGALGAIIGHELTHGFDDHGRKLDASQMLRDWWSKQDDAEFKARARRLVAQFSAYHPIPSDAQVHVNGELTLGENIADLGGLSLAIDAYRASLKGKAAPVIDGFTGEQRVFLGWAQGNRGKATDDFLRKQVVTDPHSPDKFRVNGVVRNMDAWYSAFSVGPGDLLYLAPEDRVRIW